MKGYMIRGCTDSDDLSKIMKVFNVISVDPTFESVSCTKDQTLLIYKCGSDNISLCITKNGSVEFPLVNAGDRREALIRFTFDEVMKVLDMPLQSIEDIKTRFKTEYERKLEEHRP